MNGWQTNPGTLRVFVFAALIGAGALAMFHTAHGEIAPVALSGNEEVPPVSTAAAGTAMITVHPDKSVMGTITTTGMTGTMAHIHEGALGKNGPVVVPLVKTGASSWNIAPGAKFGDAQYASYTAGNLYVNVHSAAHPDGEIRAQLKPN
jgi:CHRD domain